MTDLNQKFQKTEGFSLAGFFQMLLDENAEVYVDTSFFLHPYFMQDFVPELMEYNILRGDKLKLNYFITSIHTLQRLMLSDKTDQDTVMRARCALEELNFHINFDMKMSGFTKTQGEMISSALVGRMNRKVVVLTQNMKQARDLYKLNRFESCNARGSVEVFRYSISGRFGRFEDIVE
ncbi:MAG: hypothetical protein K6G19_06125 [Lachnospiraceae bacterium]|nr:hypothetical protein [Lachnospiraceae bacterium]